MNSLKQIWDEIKALSMLIYYIDELYYKVNRKLSDEMLKVFYFDPLTGQERFVRIDKEDKLLKKMFEKIKESETEAFGAEIFFKQINPDAEIVIKKCEDFYVCIHVVDELTTIYVSPSQRYVGLWKSRLIETVPV